MTRRKTRIVAAVSAIMLAAAVYPLGIHFKGELKFFVWNAIPGAVTDSQGRIGKLYRSPSGVLELVVFNKGMPPRPSNFLDRWFFTDTDKRSIYLMYTVDLQDNLVGDYFSDSVFSDFLLSRISGDGWISDHMPAVIKPDGHPGSYLLTDC